MFDVSPSDFWNMTVSEAYMIIDAKTPEEKVGSLGMSEFEGLAELHDQIGAA